MTHTVHENFLARVTEAAKTSGRMRVQILSAGLGSSGYYSPAVVERAATDGLVQAGTHMYLDHPSESARVDRPERSVRDIAAAFTGAASYDKATASLVGEIQVLAPYRELLAELAPFVGLSIHGSATDITTGVVEGRTVPIVEGLAAIESVDWVTKAGRGGRVLQLLESGDTSTIQPLHEPGPTHTPWGRPVAETGRRYDQGRVLLVEDLDRPRAVTPWGRPIA